MRIIPVILIFSLALFIACDEDKTTTPTESGLLIEEPQLDKLNAYPILGYIKSGGNIAPKIDGRGNDYIWQNVMPYSITAVNGKDGFAPTVTIKALYDNWYIYFLVYWEDETKSLEKNTWWFGQSDPTQYTTINLYDSTFIYYTPPDTIYSDTDTTYFPADTVSVNKKVRDTVHKEWSVISEPFTGIIETITYRVNVIIDSMQTPPTISYLQGNTSSDFDTIFVSGDEDGFSMFWENEQTTITSCSNLCHGSSMATPENQTLDVWQWGALKTNSYSLKDFAEIAEFLGYADDKYLTKNGFLGDAGDSTCIPNVNDLFPKYIDYHNSGNTGFNPFYLHDSLWVTTIYFAKTLPWQGTNMLPGFVRHKPTASRDDVRLNGTHDSGVWTLEIKRPLFTEDEVDIQFNPNTENDYDFYISVFDNSHGSSHAVSEQVHKLHFLQLSKEN